jgi:hypothetical protein
MLSNQYLTLAYVIGLGLLWGYVASLWISRRALDRRGGSKS